jgi:hypothetical protein
MTFSILAACLQEMRAGHLQRANWPFATRVLVSTIATLLHVGDPPATLAR